MRPVASFSQSVTLPGMATVRHTSLLLAMALAATSSIGCVFMRTRTVGPMRVQESRVYTLVVAPFTDLTGTDAALALGDMPLSPLCGRWW